MVSPERRTRIDLLVAATIAIVVATAAALIWWTSDARATISKPAAIPLPLPTPARAVPTALRQLWSAASPATTGPVVVAGTVATGDGHQVIGRDPSTGEPRWSYSRNTDLCAVSWVYHFVVAVYPDDRGCGQVSSLDAATGRRGPARTSYADAQVSVSSDGMAVLSAGATRLELWRSDMVRTLAYGEIDARVKPSARGLRSGCVLTSAAASSSTVSVLEACPQHAELRLTLLRPGKEDDEPDQRYVSGLGVKADSGARVLAVSDTSTAVYLPSPQPKVEVIDQTGTTVASTLLPTPPLPSAAVSRPGGLVTWWTGDAVLVFDGTDLTYRYTMGAVGPA
ncbi:MAG: PQQ-like beta-propeller repeat protein, partial [Mycobacteriaceae bacterium]|nr:PQQ-like beta-propeller repeat protein [Mycobacteriaceae bacterium]